MIQRIQTLFLSLAAIMGTFMFFVPLASFISDFYYLKLYIYAFQNQTPGSELQFGIITVLPLILINAAVVIITVYAIFKYKKRILQIKLVRFTMLLSMLLIVGVFVLYPNVVINQTDAVTEFEIGAYVPIVNLLFLLLANRFIVKDERLIRSMDRLR
ncbi:MAG: DUF4293 domain-containing protein [Bacteroidetes bacterium]|nr:DUF4293 domain-containing protein [Bacteroidota bacterium]